MNTPNPVSDNDRSRWRYHPDRELVITEPHARPSVPVASSDFVVHLGFTCSDDDLTHLIGSLEASSASARHYIKVFDNVQVKLERHTEFVSLTCVTRSHERRDDVYTVLDVLLESVDAEMIVMTQVIMCETRDQLESQLSDNHTVYGGVMRGDMEVRSSLVPNFDGCLVYVVHSPSTAVEETGRRIQRLLEMETYRTMTLLGLPAARRAGDKLTFLEAGVDRVVAQMNTEQTDTYTHLFDQVSSLSQETNKLQSDTRFRFSASRAYYDLAQQRLQSLHEQKSDGLQTISGFVRSRLEPGMATIDSVSKRQSMLAVDIDNALSLLRTRIDLGLNRDNQSLLKSMDARHRQQVLIAQTVEGLSTVAISYYTIGLLQYLIKGWGDWLPVSSSTAVAIAVPFVVFGVWAFLHSKRTRWEKESR
jgi:uncharacterized membrane-anchored protein